MRTRLSERVMVNITIANAPVTYEVDRKLLSKYMREEVTAAKKSKVRDKYYVFDKGRSYYDVISADRIAVIRAIQIEKLNAYIRGERI